MNFKKISIVSVIACSVSSVVFAGQHGSVYVAADAGIFQADYVNRYLDQTDLIPQNISQNIQQNGYTGGLSIGYSKSLCPAYFLGAELAGNNDGHNGVFQSGAASSAFSDEIQINHHIDLTFIPGVQLNELTSAYLKLGISWAFIYNSLTSPTGFTPTYETTTANKTTPGFVAGLGLARNITKQVSMFIEANYHDYGQVNFASFQNFTATYTHSTHVYAYDAEIGLAYRFDV